MTTILQSLIGRCRDNFTTTSATAVLVPGTRRRMTGLTVGSYLDISAEVSCSLGAAADAMFQVFLGTTVAGMAAINEGAGSSTATAADWTPASIRTLYGPITAAQATAGLWFDLRAATSADTLSITAITTPTKYSAVLRVDEVSVAEAIGLPTRIPNLLLWLKADSGVVQGANKSVSSWTDSGTAKVLAYDAQSGNFTAGLIVTGGTSGATATIASDTDAGTTGTLVLTDVVGTFVDNEAITDSSTGAAVVNGTAAALTVSAGVTPPVYEPSVINSLPGVYFDVTKAASLVFDNLPKQATAFIAFAVVSLDTFVNAGESLLNPPVAAAADCLRVTLSNATVNRNALLDTGKPEYVSTTTTVTSGKALMRWRFNLGTTTGAAAVNGGAEVTDTSFDPPQSTWAFIGSPDAATYKVGGFRLCELIIFSLAQASTEDAMSVSDATTVRDYLNAKWAVY